MNNMHTAAPTTTTSRTLQDAYTCWLKAPHPKMPALKNQDRKENDRKNFERALRAFAMGASKGVTSLELLPLETLNVGEGLLERHVEQGILLLCTREGKAAPSEKTIKNLISGCKAIHKTVFTQAEVPVRKKSPKKRLAERPKRQYRERFPRSAWPQSLQTDWEGYRAWKMKPFLSPEEGERFRRKTCKAVTIEAHAKRINPYVGYLVRERDLQDINLNTLCDLTTYTDYLNWYLSLDADGGYDLAQDTGTTLATISQYLVAKGRMKEKDAYGKNIWDAFYQASQKPLSIGAARGELSEAWDVGDWKPEHLAELAVEALDLPPPRYWRGEGTKYQKMVFSRTRSGLFFALAYETPLRARNFIEMRWGKNLKQTPEGLWEVIFRGEELKVAQRGHKTNEYRCVYSHEVSACIDAWRAFLRECLGDDFERRCPYVFASSDLTPEAMSYQAFKTNIEQLVLELRGEKFTPHMVRHIIGSFLVNEFGPGGLGLAAELLGDTVEVILRSYYKPNNMHTRQGYLAMRKRT